MDVARIGADLQNTLVELTDEARAAADAVAERAVTIGDAPDGRVSTVAKESPLPEVPDGRVADTTVVDLVVDALSTVINRMRPRVDRLGDLDPVTQDLLIEVLAGLEKQRWMFSAQQR